MYEFVCMTCESHYEELLRVDDADPGCPDCGSEKVRRQFSVFAAHGTAVEDANVSIWICNCRQSGSQTASCLASVWLMYEVRSTSQ